MARGSRRHALPLVWMTLAFMLCIGLMGAWLFLQIAPEAGGSEAAPLLARGRASMTANDPDAAVRELTAAIDLEPSSARARLARGDAYMRLRDRRAAIEDYTAALAIDDTLTAARIGRARAREATGDPAGALEDYDLLVERHPTRGDLWRRRGRVHHVLGVYETAVEHLARARELAPDLQRVDHDLAWAQWGVGDYEAALTSFDRATGRPSPGLHTYFGRGVTLYHLGLLSQARGDLGRAAAMRGGGNDYARFYLWLATAELLDRAAADAPLRAHVNRVKPGGWTGAIASFLLGDIAEDELLARADAGGGSGPPAAGRRCEAFFYAGARRRLDGDDAGAAALFRRSIATDVRNYYEWFSARAELRRLERRPGPALDLEDAD